MLIKFVSSDNDASTRSFGAFLVRGFGQLVTVKDDLAIPLSALRASFFVDDSGVNVFNVVRHSLFKIAQYGRE